MPARCGSGDESFAGEWEARRRPGRINSIVPLRQFKARAEKEYIERVLQETGWNVAAAARLLGIQRTFLHQKITTLAPGDRRPTTAKTEVEL